MRRWLVGWVVTTGGCLDRNPVFIDPTEGDMAGETTSPPPVTDTVTTTAPLETTAAASTTSVIPETTGPDANTDTEGTLDPTTTGDTGMTGAMPVAVCGNDVVEPGEECDDGNVYPYDACLENCVKATCGDLVVQDWVEECDDGKNGDNDDGCFDDCTGPVCGDGSVHIPEDCDDMNANNGDGCENDCSWTSKIIFVTSKTYTGKMGGLLGADKACMELAQNAKNGPLPGTYLAWLSTTNESPLTRMTHPPFRYVRSDPERTLIVHSWDELIDGTPFGPINFNEHGEIQAPILDNRECGGARVHTNTLASGEMFDTGTDCLGWNSTFGSSLMGSLDGGQPGWTEACQGMTCKLLAPIYCVQQ